jgi:hypothetical protein
MLALALGSRLYTIAISRSSMGSCVLDLVDVLWLVYGTGARPTTAAHWSTFSRPGSRIPPNAVTKEKAAEIAADFMTTFYHIQIGAPETQEFRTTPVPFWLVSFSYESIKGPARQMYFVVVLPNGKIVEPRVTRRL